MKILICMIGFCCSTAWATPSQENPIAPSSFLYGYFKQNCTVSDNIIFCGEKAQLTKFHLWLNKILQTPIGQLTLDKIKTAPHILLIRHNPYAVSAGGKTLAPLTSRLEDGRGDDVMIEMNFDMPSAGSHLVPAIGSSELISFTGDQNLMHELSHAQHKINGTWIMMLSEEQAIDDENLYRTQSTPESHPPLRNAEAYGEGIQIWDTTG